MSADGIYVPPQRIGIKTLGDGDEERATSTVEAALLPSISTAIRFPASPSTPTSPLDLSEDGPTLALRMRRSPSVDGRTEFEWLRAVRQSTMVCTVEPFAEDFAGNTRVVVQSDATPINARCSCGRTGFHWQRI